MRGAPCRCLALDSWGRVSAHALGLCRGMFDLRLTWLLGTAVRERCQTGTGAQADCDGPSCCDWV